MEGGGKTLSPRRRLKKITIDSCSSSEASPRPSTHILKNTPPPPREYPLVIAGFEIFNFETIFLSIFLSGFVLSIFLSKKHFDHFFQCFLFDKKIDQFFVRLFFGAKKIDQHFFRRFFSTKCFFYEQFFRRFFYPNFFNRKK